METCPTCQESLELKQVADTEPIFHCSACGIIGNQSVYDFWKAIKEAQLPSYLGKSVEVTSDYKILANYAGLYTTALKNASEPMAYLHDRRIGMDAIDKFSLGYADMNLRIPVEEISDLAKLGVANSKGIQFFSRRITFPIKDIFGRVCGFGGRAISDGIRPKYLNSPDTILYDKGNMLYGFYECYHAVITGAPILLVEGYFDVIRCQMNGFNAIAPMGTGLTWKHASIIARHMKEITILTDSDTAGKVSAYRSKDLLTGWGVKVRVGDIPILKDPDEFIREYGADAFQAECVDRARYI